MSKKLWLCGITSQDNENNLRELIEPVKDYFAGLNWTFHLPKDDGAKYLESVKGLGEIVYMNWCARHHFSMNNYLYQSPMQDGDYFIQIDSLERIGANFCQSIHEKIIPDMEKQGLAVICNYGKPLIIKFNEQLEFAGSPHWYVKNIDGKYINTELPKSDFWNVRDRERNEWQFLDHYLKYYIAYPAGSNHCLLGLEKNGNPQELFPVREARRLEFRNEMKKRGYALTVEAVKDLIKKELDDKMKDFFNSEKILNDAYRHFKLGKTDFKDDHDFGNMIKI